MKKVLFIANTDRHIKLCHLPYLKMFKDNGYEVHVVTNTSNALQYCDKKICIDLKRNPFHFRNLLAVFKIRKIVKEEKYDLITCHTPMGGLLGRSAVIKTKLKTKVFYTAHGFHFYKGASFISWLIYYTIEKFLSRYTDLLLTMNKEDYDIAKEKFKCRVVKINGIGMDEERLVLHKKNIRGKLHIEDKFVVTYIAEISKRKNQKNLLKTLKKYDLDKENIELLLIGDTITKNFDEYVKKYNNVKYLSFKSNVGDYINASDLVVFPSRQEGLPLAVLEAMSFNKMIIAFDIRGCRDLIKNKKNGLLIPRFDYEKMIDEIIKYKNKTNKRKITNNIERYKIDKVIKQVKKEYNKFLNEKLR